MGEKVLTASKGILLWCSSVVGHLYAPPLVHDIVEQIKVGFAIEAVVGWSRGWGAEVGVDISEAGGEGSVCMSPSSFIQTYTVMRETSPG
jgi:hypothetical protein